MKGAVLPGMSMVPLADIFNHKAAVVALAGGYSIEQVRFFLGSSPFLHMPALAVFPGARCRCECVVGLRPRMRTSRRAPRMAAQTRSMNLVMLSQKQVQALFKPHVHLAWRDPARMVIIHSPSNVRRGCAGAGAHRDMHGASLVGRPVMDEHASEAGA